MEFELFPGARDLFYLAVLFFGAAAGFILNRFRKKSTTRRRNRSLTLAYCCLSAVVAALAAAFIVSRGAVFLEKSFYLPGGVIFILLVLAVRFPKAAGFPLIFLGGLAAVWLAWSFLRFPSAVSFPVASITGDGSRVTVRTASVSGSAATVDLDLDGGGASLEFVFTGVSYARQWPVIGGRTRGLITGINGSRSLYSAPPPPRPIPAGGRRGEIRGRAPGIEQGAAFDVFVAGNTLIFR